VYIVHILSSKVSKSFIVTRVVSWLDWTV